MKKIHALFGALFFSLPLASIAFAQEAGQWALGLRAGPSIPTGSSGHFTVTDFTDGSGPATGKLKLKLGPMVSGKISHGLTDRFSLGLDLEWDTHKIPNETVCLDNCGNTEIFTAGGRLHTLSLMPFVEVHPMRGGRLSPYLSLALGGNFNWIGDRPSGPGLARGLSSDADHSFALKAGGGLDYFLTNNLAFNTEVGWKMNRRGHIRFAGVIDDSCCGGGAEAGLAKARLRASTVSVLFGVRYFFPKPAGAIVEKPVEKIVTREVVKEVPVVKEVIKEVPGPERVVEVPKYITVERIVFSDIAFDFDKATLTDLGKGRVYLVAQKLKENKSIKVVVEGHTDFIGTDEYNQALGLRRSNAVREELARLGISADRMSTVSYGESKPLLDMKTDWGRAVNRRVEFEISGEVPAAQK